MLKLLNIKKDYLLKDQEPVHALKGISLNFRRNEFVAILGHSGCGKTTLLNIIGGLDRYSEGDLIIEGKSTKQFSDRDWDNYRNHSIGFVFQSYNLIGHQSILKNVELALTISGIGKAERKRRAEEALVKVGLGGLGKKKPNQLSGGQMQRVAIARALVNNPEIVLADEPTGALDSETSIQIMDLLKEVAQDRLVIMVTHNPELATQYANRIVSMKDGLLLNDTNPFEGEKNKPVKQEEKTSSKKSLMSFWTATGLSFNNLLSKARRTILVSIAGSIGIIGISAVLAVSFGVTGYIASMQDDMLSSYPLSIAEEAVDLSSLTTGLNNSSDLSKVAEFDVTTQVGMQSMVNYLMEKYSDISNVKTNDINEDLLTYLSDMDSKNVVTTKLNYGIDVTNNIFTTTADSVDPSKDQVISLNGLTQRYISELKTVTGFDKYASYVSLFTNFLKAMPDNEEYILSQYDLLGNSKFAREYNELMLVVDTNTTLTDLLLAQMGFYSHDDFLNISKKAIKTNEARKNYENNLISKSQYEKLMKEYDEKYKYPTHFDFDYILDKEFYYVPSKTIWEYGNVSQQTSMTGSVLINSTSDIFYLQYSSFNSYDLLVGYRIDIINGGEPQTVTFARPVSYSRDPETFLLGNWGGVDLTTLQSNYSILSITSEGGAKKATYIDTLGNTSTYTNVFVSASETDLVNGYNYPAVAKPSWLSSMGTSGAVKVKISGILRAKDTTKFGSLTRGVYYNDRLTEKFIIDAADPNNSIVNDEEKGFLNHFNSGLANDLLFPAYVTYDYLDYHLDENNPTLVSGGYAYALNGSGSNSIAGLLSNVTGRVNYLDTNVSCLRAIAGIKAIENSEAGLLDDPFNFKTLPESIKIYPKDFKSKDVITDYLKAWNKDSEITLSTGKVLKKSDRKELTYTDTVQMIITVINMLITIITSALIAFTSLSLVVSCFMIAVITYISVVERVKEIGVIRSLGGRKKDVARLFTAENLMTGFSSGVIGVVITYLLSLLLNGIVSVFGVPAIAALPWWTALIMIVLSILLNVISGFIPSRSASKQDPVIALRSE